MIQRKNRTSWIKLDLRWACLAVAPILFSLFFINEAEFQLLVSVAAAGVACLLAMASVGYSVTSFISILALTHLLFYPLAVCGNLLLPEVAVRWDLWRESNLAMWGCTVGVLALAMGAKLANFAKIKRAAQHNRIFSKLPKLKINIFLVSLIVPCTLVLKLLGVYYHSSITDNNPDSGAYLNIITILIYISTCGIFLQTYRYTQTHSTKDACWALALSLFTILIFLPSGARMAAMGFLPLLILAFSAWETTNYRKLIAWAAVIVTIMIFTAGVSSYRSIKGVDQLSFGEKYDTIMKSTIQPEKGETDFYRIIVGRFSDYVAVGVIISATPEAIDYRGTEGMEHWWQIYVPGFLHIISDRIDLLDGVELCDRYGITKTRLRASSRPAMIIGDLFSRWGWPGVFIGMFTLGFILRQFDLRIFNRWNTFTIIFYVLFGRYVLSMHGATVVNIFISLFRDVLVMAVVSYLLASMVAPRFSGVQWNTRTGYHLGWKR